MLEERGLDIPPGAGQGLSVVIADAAGYQLTMDSGREPVHLGTIHDAVEKRLMTRGAHDVAQRRGRGVRDL